MIERPESLPSSSRLELQRPNEAPLGLEDGLNVICSLFCQAFSFAKSANALDEWFTISDGVGWADNSLKSKAISRMCIIGLTVILSEHIPAASQQA